MQTLQNCKWTEIIRQNLGQGLMVTIILVKSPTYGERSSKYFHDLKESNELLLFNPVSKMKQLMYNLRVVLGLQASPTPAHLLEHQFEENLVQELHGHRDKWEDIGKELR